MRQIRRRSVSVRSRLIVDGINQDGDPLETVSKRPRGAVNFRGELLTSGIGTTETEEMAKPIIDDELWTL
ncbi:hypothetical protein KDW98_23730, partial [Burkholderia vietnamiensis]|uniref:hypothetical protein n=1 Tax=Burkholderia vietnamiensis TaxID=60552 RepID=UPI001B97E9AA